MTQEDSRTSRLVGSAGLVLALMASLCFAHVVQSKIYPSTVRIGTIDFVAYWTAYQLYEDPELDPYDTEMLLHAQRQLGADYEAPQVVWNLPLLFPLLAPVLHLPFDTAVTVWFGLNCFFVFLISLLTWKTVTDAPVRPIACILAGAISFPVAQNIYFGQLSLFITLGVVLCFWSIKYEKDWLAGIALVPLTLKPHMAYLVIPVLGLWIIHRKRWWVMISFGIAVAILTGIMLIQSPSIVHDRIHMPENPVMWKSATPVVAIGEIIHYATGAYPLWPLIVIPLIGMIGVLFHLRFGKAVRWETHLPWLICLSLVTAPFGWVFDHSIGMIAQVGLLALVFAHRAPLQAKLELIGWLALLQACAFALPLFGVQQHHFFWYPIALLCVWHRGVKIAGVDTGLDAGGRST